MKITLVIAGSYEQYRYWLREKKLSSQEYVYVDGQEQIMGMRGCKVEKWGEYWKSPLFENWYLDMIEDDLNPITYTRLL